MARTNKYGKSDYIPAEIKRTIRQQCGFGCVNCGSPFYDYEHWNPPFEELNDEPSADGITLCCPSCHRIKGGLLSMEEYMQNIKSPFGLRKGQVSTTWSKGFSPEIVLGSVKCSGGTRILEIDNNLMMGFLPPESEGAPPRLLIRFFDRNGNECFRIDNNECIGNPTNWDITSNRINTGGWKWVIRNNPRKIDLDLEIHPPDRIEVKKMLWQFGSLRIVASNLGLQLSLRQSNGNYINQLLLKDMSAKALKAEHSFLKIDRVIKQITPNQKRTTHNININNMQFDGGGIGTLSMSPTEPLIK